MPGRVFELKKKNLEKGLYSADFLTGVVNSLVPSDGEGVIIRNVSNTIKKLGDRNKLKIIRQKSPVGPCLNFVDYDGLLEVLHFYLKLGKIGEYLDKIEGIVVDRKKTFLSTKVY